MSTADVIRCFCVASDWLMHDSKHLGGVFTISPGEIYHQLGKNYSKYLFPGVMRAKYMYAVCLFVCSSVVTPIPTCSFL